MSPFNPKAATPNRLARELVLNLAKDYRAHGAAVIEHLRRNEPRTYLRLILALPYVEPPRAEEVRDSYTGEQLDAMIVRANARIREAEEWDKQWEKDTAGQEVAEGEIAASSQQPTCE